MKIAYMQIEMNFVLLQAKCMMSSKTQQNKNKITNQFQKYKIAKCCVGVSN